MNGTALITAALLAGAVVGGGVVFGAQALNKSTDQLVTVLTEGPVATVSAANCQGETCDVTVEVDEWNAIDALVVENRESGEKTVLTLGNARVTFENVSEQYTTGGGQGAILTYLPVLDREGTGHAGRKFHRIVNLKEEPKTIQPAAIGTYCASKSKIVVDGEWKESDYQC